MARAVRIITYEGPDAWMRATLDRSLGGDMNEVVRFTQRNGAECVVEEAYRYVAYDAPDELPADEGRPVGWHVQPIRMAAVDNREVWV